MGGQTLVRLPILKKENSEFKSSVLRLEIEVLLHQAVGEIHTCAFNVEDVKSNKEE